MKAPWADKATLSDAGDYADLDGWDQWMRERMGPLFAELWEKSDFYLRVQVYGIMRAMVDEADGTVIDRVAR
jgi:hypothetical protein